MQIWPYSPAQFEAWWSSSQHEERRLHSAGLAAVCVCPNHGGWGGELGQLFYLGMHLEKFPSWMVVFWLIRDSLGQPSILRLSLSGAIRYDAVVSGRPTEYKKTK